MPPADAILDPEEEYASEEDSDFTPEDVPANESSVSDDEDSADDKPAPGKRKRPVAEPEAEDAGFENSGDEAIIDKGKKRRKRGKGKDGAANDDDEAEGPLIKTRSMRATEKTEKRTAAVSGPVTIDVDAVWAQMMNDSSAQSVLATQDKPRETALPPSQPDTTAVTQNPRPGADGEQSESIRIKRTYNFAGKVHTEEKVVARDSAEARLYLASLENRGSAEPVGDDDAPSKKMPRKAFRSIFEPIPDQAAMRTDLNLGMSVRLRARELANEANAKKLNTVEKSRMDWAGYVDREGLKDELDLAGKSKHSYTARQDFLARAEAKRDEDERRVRLAAKT
ncbi:hypothetical protein OQA88_233 [Cercophora sp. LCS_1]